MRLAGEKEQSDSCRGRAAMGVPGRRLCLARNVEGVDSPSGSRDGH